MFLESFEPTASNRPLHEVFKVALPYYGNSKGVACYYMCNALELAVINHELNHTEYNVAKEWIGELLTFPEDARKPRMASLAFMFARITGLRLGTNEEYLRQLTFMAWDAMIDKLEHDYNESH